MFNFKKMNGLGNDFIMMLDSELPYTDMESYQTLAKKVCDRHFGIGADGLIIAAPPQDREAYDVRFIYINSDGSLAEMCGNGIRCFAKFVTEAGLIQQPKFRIETLAGLIEPELNKDGSITVNMGAPVLNPANVPFSAVDAPAYPNMAQHLSYKNGLECWPISMGNPHCILFNDAYGCGELEPSIDGPGVEVAPQFTAKTNVEFVTRLDENHFNVVVWERGCGFTQACGTGACATTVAAILSGRADASRPVQITLPGGSMMIEWNGDLDAPIFMTGPAVTVCEGVLCDAMTHHTAPITTA